MRSEPGNLKTVSKMSIKTDRDGTGHGHRQGDRLGEFQLIARYLAPLAKDPGAFGLKDDVCQLAVPDGQDLVISKDMLVSTIHFLPDDPPDLIAQKALRVNLSDLTAKGAAAAGYMLGLSLPDGWSEDWLGAFVEGLRRDGASFSHGLLGGDTVRSGSDRLTVSVTVFGFRSSGTILNRSSASAGDHLYVTGTIGEAALGLLLHMQKASGWQTALTSEDRRGLVHRYLLPQNRQSIHGLVCEFASASMDLSDGLIGDLQHICEASGLQASLDAQAIPLSGAARRACDADPACFEICLTGGDDYEVLFSVPDSRHAAFQAAIRSAPVPITRIGTLEDGVPSVSVLDADGEHLTWVSQSFSHF